MIHILDSIRLRFRKDRQLYADLFAILGFYPHKIAYYRQALAHSSVREKTDNGQMINNERLEFLGDAIIEAVVSDIVFHRFTKKREGFLTTTRSKVVQRDTLNKLAVELNLHKMIHASVNNEDQHHSSMAGNAFEALIGAIYLDRGFAACQWFIRNRIIDRLINLDDLAYKETNYKSKLLEWSQKHRIKVDFTIVSTEKEGTDSPVFCAAVCIEGLKVSEAKGFSKKESHQLAAKEAFLRLKHEPQLVRNLLKRNKTGEEGTQSAASENPAGDTKKEKRRKARFSPVLTEQKKAVDVKDHETVGENIPENAGKRAKSGTEDDVAQKEAVNSIKKRRRKKKKPVTENSDVRVVVNIGDKKVLQKEQKETIVQAAEEAAFTQSETR